MLTSCIKLQMMRVGENELYRLIGERLRQRREELGLKQSDVAAEVGLRRTSVTNIEAGKQKPPLHVLYGVCIALDIEPAQLLPSNTEVLAHRLVAVEVGNETKRVPPQAAQVLNKLLRT